jgi:hypothetical protein
MDSSWPQAVFSLETFLEGAGLVRQRLEEQPVFNNRVLQYGSSEIGVRVISDRGVWYVEISDVANRPDEWYDVAILRDFLVGPGKDVLPLANQIDFVKKHWAMIVDSFSLIRVAETHARLVALKIDRARRRFPNLHRAGSPNSGGSEFKQ